MQYSACLSSSNRNLTDSSLAPHSRGVHYPTVRLQALSPLSVRRSLPLFLAIVVGLAIWQVWLTWRLIEQDRNLAAQHSRERLEQVAGLAVAQLSSALGEWDLSVRELDTLPPSAALKAKLPPNATLVLLAHQSVA